MPGICDLHTHSDRTIATNPGATSSLLQGVTTVSLLGCFE